MYSLQSHTQLDSKCCIWLVTYPIVDSKPYPMIYIYISPVLSVHACSIVLYIYIYIPSSFYDDTLKFGDSGGFAPCGVSHFSDFLPGNANFPLQRKFMVVMFQSIFTCVYDRCKYHQICHDDIAIYSHTGGCSSIHFIDRDFRHDLMIEYGHSMSFKWILQQFITSYIHDVLYLCMIHNPYIHDFRCPTSISQIYCILLDSFGINRGW